MSSSSMSHAGMVRAHTHSLWGTINGFSRLKNWYLNNQFLAISEINVEFESQIMVFSTCKNVGEIFRTLRQRLHRNCRTRQIGHVRITFPIGRLGVKLPTFSFIKNSKFRRKNVFWGQKEKKNNFFAVQSRKNVGGSKKISFLNSVYLITWLWF